MTSRVAAASVLVFMMAACTPAASSPPSPPAPASSVGPGPSSAPVASVASVASVAAVPSVRSVAPQPGFWPDRACTTGTRALVLEDDCGCDATMTCDVTTSPGVLALTVHARQTVCKDCAPHTRVTCTLPKDARGSWRVTLGGAELLPSLTLAPDGSLSVPACAPLH